MTERKDLTKDEKLFVLESAIDRTKVNKNSKFNKSHKNPFHWNIECNMVVISAELYTRKEAFEKIIEEYKYEILWCDYENDVDCKEYTDWLTEQDIKFWFIKFNWVAEADERVWAWLYNDCLPPTNFHKPVYYLDLW